MNFRALTQVDIDWMREHTVDKEFWKESQEQIGMDYCLEDDGKVLVVGGVRLMNPNTAVGWIDISEEGFKRLIIVFRTVSEWMIHLSEALNFTRLEAYVRAGFGAGVRTVEHLGFGFERKVPRYFGDTDALLFVRFFEQEKK